MVLQFLGQSVSRKVHRIMGTSSSHSALQFIRFSAKFIVHCLKKLLSCYDTVAAFCQEIQKQRMELVHEFADPEKEHDKEVKESETRY